MMKKSFVGEVAASAIPTEASDSRWETWYHCLAVHVSSCVDRLQAPISLCELVVLLLVGLYQKLHHHCGADWGRDEIHYCYLHHY